MGRDCLSFHDEAVRGIRPRYVQADEMWGFCYAKKGRSRSPEAGDAWTWTAIDVDTKLLISWLVGDRSPECAVLLMDDLRSRTLGRYQLSTDGYKPYPEAVMAAFGREVDYAQVVGNRRDICLGRPDLAEVTSSAVERHNLTMRMSVRRYTRRTNGFSKKRENLIYAAALYAVWYNWIRAHQGLGGRTPAQAAGLAEYPLSLRWLLGLL